MRLQPRLIPTIATVVVAVTCVRLGFWQLKRYDQSQSISQTMTTAWEASPLTRLDNIEESHLSYRRARLKGHWPPHPGAFVTGGLVGGQPGYQWIAPFETDQGTRLLVNRGWVPVNADRALIETLQAEAPTMVEGLLLPIDGNPNLTPTMSDSGMTRWPLDSDLLFGVLPRVLGLPYAAIAASEDSAVIGHLLAIGPAYHDARERKPGPLPVTGYDLPLPKVHHLSYAAQWFGFAGLALVLWGWSSWIREERRS